VTTLMSISMVSYAGVLIRKDSFVLP